MQNETKITCPQCKNTFELAEIYRKEIETKIIEGYENKVNKAILEAQQKIKQEELQK